MVKMYDCQNMPEEIKMYFLKNSDVKCNDVVLEVLVNKKGTDILSDYLIEDGVKWDDTVFIKHWW
jgi:hypothetical protein